MATAKRPEKRNVGKLAMLNKGKTASVTPVPPCLANHTRSYDSLREEAASDAMCMHVETI